MTDPAAAILAIGTLMVGFMAGKAERSKPEAEADPGAPLREKLRGPGIDPGPPPLSLKSLHGESYYCYTAEEIAAALAKLYPANPPKPRKRPR